MNIFCTIVLLVLWCVQLTHHNHKYFKGLQMRIGADYQIASVKNPARNIPRPDLNQRAKDILNKFGLEGFERYFGSIYLGGVVSGGMYLGMISMYTKTQSERSSIVRGVKFFGFVVNVKLDLLTSASNIVKTRRVEVYGVQIGGQPQTQVLEYPIPLEGIFHKYQDTIPFDWEAEGIDYRVRDRLLQTLRVRLSNLKDRRNDLQYVQNNYNTFETLKIKSSSQKNEDLKQIFKEIYEITTETDKINQVVVDCVLNFDKCIEPKSTPKCLRCLNILMTSFLRLLLS